MFESAFLILCVKGPGLLLYGRLKVGPVAV